MSEQREQRWQFEKKVSVGDVIAFTMAFLAVVYAYTTLDKRLAVLEDRRLEQVARDVRQDSDRNAIKQDLRDDLSRIAAELVEIRRILAKQK